MRPVRSATAGSGRWIIGGTEEYRVVLNESSVWSGGPYEANRPDAFQNLSKGRELYFAGDVLGAQDWFARKFQYPDGVSGWWNENQFGCYQILADLYLRFPAHTRRAVVSSPSGHAIGDRGGNPQNVMIMTGLGAGASRSSADDHTIHCATDGDPNTKWCVIREGKDVVWQVALPAPAKVERYTLTSADDVPTRDPERWTLEGSHDGQAWTVVDEQSLPAPFEQRHQAKSFTVARPGVFRHYRFTFVTKDPSFQIGELSLDGVPVITRVPVPEDYRRDLNLMTGLATTQFTVNGVTYTRQLVVSNRMT